MTENDKPPSEKPPGIELGYAAPLRHAAGPTPFQVFAGTVSVLFGLAPLAVALLLLWLATGAWFHFKTLGKAHEPLPRSGLIGVLLTVAFCLFASKVMFGMARRLFRGNKNA